MIQMQGLKTVHENIYRSINLLGAKLMELKNSGKLTDEAIVELIKRETDNIKPNQEIRSLS